jgi:hypothetical protein
MLLSGLESAIESPRQNGYKRRKWAEAKGRKEASRTVARILAARCVFIREYSSSPDSMKLGETE